MAETKKTQTVSRRGNWDCIWYIPQELMLNTFIGIILEVKNLYIVGIWNWILYIKHRKFHTIEVGKIKVDK